MNISQSAREFFARVKKENIWKVHRAMHAIQLRFYNLTRYKASTRLKFRQKGIRASLAHFIEKLFVTLKLLIVRLTFIRNFSCTVYP